MVVDCNPSLIADEAGFIALSQSSYTAVLLHLDSIRGNLDDTANKPQKPLSASEFEAKCFTAGLCLISRKIKLVSIRIAQKGNSD